MQIIKGLKSLPALPTTSKSPKEDPQWVLTIGSFDGVHLGHRALIRQVVESAKKLRVQSAVLSFDPHPAVVLRPQYPFAQLFNIEDMAQQIESLGVNELIIEPFNEELAALSAKEFIQKILERMKLKVLLVGYDFAFGRNREGGFLQLKKLGEQFDFEVVQFGPEKLDDEVISSSRIRKLLELGDVEKAEKLLGRPYSLEGVVVTGDGRGRALGFATANLSCETALKPKAGVYITRFHLIDLKSGGVETFNSVTNIGYKPTFYEKHDLSIETHVFDTDQNFVGKKVRLELLKRLRDELKFNSSHELIKQIESDVRQTRKYFGK